MSYELNNISKMGSHPCRRNPGQIEVAACPRLSILTWHRLYSDPQGCGPGARPFHCTSVWLTPAIFPNVEDSGAQFISVGDCVRALP